MTKEKEIQEILLSNINRERLGLTEDEYRLLIILLIRQLLNPRLTFRNISPALINALIAMFVKRTIITADYSETDYWIKKIREILNPKKK